MLDLRDIGERVLALSLEGPFGSTVILTGPDGVQQEVRGQVVIEPKHIAEDSRGVEQGGRQSLLTTRCSVTLRRSSLNPVPDSEEFWTCEIPLSPMANAPKKTMAVEYVPEGSNSLGLLTLRLVDTEQI